METERPTPTDFDDLQDELAGRETGRPKRFLDDEDPRNPRSDDRKREKEEFARQQLDALRRLQEIRDNANRDALGRLVFRSRDGVHAFYEDGTEMTPEDIAAVQWRKGAPTWEEYQSAVTAWEEAGAPAAPSAAGPVSPEIPTAGPGKPLNLKF